MINREDNIYLSSLKKNYQQERDELYDTKIKPVTVKEMTEVIDDKYSIFYDNINEKFDELKNRRDFLDYFRYKYGTYTKDYFADEKVKSAIYKEEKRSKSIIIINKNIKVKLEKKDIPMFIEKHIKIYHPNEDEKKMKNLRSVIKMINQYNL